METAEHDEWSRLGEYLDKLAFENDRLEAELKIKKARRLEREAESRAAPLSRTTRFEEARSAAHYETQTVTEALGNLHISYDALSGDLKGLMSDLAEFKTSRQGLEAKLHS